MDIRSLPEITQRHIKYLEESSKKLIAANKTNKKLGHMCRIFSIIDSMKVFTDDISEMKSLLSSLGITLDEIDNMSNEMIENFILDPELNNMNMVTDMEETAEIFLDKLNLVFTNYEDIQIKNISFTQHLNGITTDTS